MDDSIAQPTAGNINGAAAPLAGAGNVAPPVTTDAVPAAPIDNTGEATPPAAAPAPEAGSGLGSLINPTPEVDPSIEMGTPQPQENLYTAESSPSTDGMQPVSPAEAAPAPEMPAEDNFSQQSSVNMELGGEAPAAPAPEQAAPSTPVEPEAAPSPANPEQELNIPPEIAAAKMNVQNSAAPQAQPVQAAASKFPMIRIIIIAAAILVLAGGYFTYKHFAKGPSSTSDQTFISE